MHSFSEKVFIWISNFQCADFIIIIDMMQCNFIFESVCCGFIICIYVYIWKRLQIIRNEYEMMTNALKAANLTVHWIVRDREIKTLPKKGKITFIFCLHTMKGRKKADWREMTYVLSFQLFEMLDGCVFAFFFLSTQLQSVMMVKPFGTRSSSSSTGYCHMHNVYICELY